MSEFEEPFDEDELDTVFPNAGEFVQNWLLPVFNRKTKGNDVFWCSEWWKHPEAVFRLTGLWRSWEVARADPSTMGSWTRDQLDYHLQILMSSTGPFRYCSPTEHNSARYQRDTAALIKEPPPGVFDMLI